VYQLLGDIVLSLPLVSIQHLFERVCTLLCQILCRYEAPLPQTVILPLRSASWR
jgi:hypothetical protein